MNYTLEEFSKVLSAKINISAEEIQKILESFSDIMCAKLIKK